MAVYSDCDRRAQHVRMADEACAIGPDPAVESYLRIDKMLDAARRTGADAVHPGYGFLAENPDFADECERAGLIFVGPGVQAMRLLGSKSAARALAARIGVPIVPGTSEPLTRDGEESRAAAAIGFPLLVKAIAGGGGKGMRVARTPAELAGSIAAARSEAAASFGDDRVYLERWIERARHIEVQLLGDHYGTVTPFVERECSIQRRHQKLIEETPSAAVTPVLRQRLAAAAAELARAGGYSSAGTAEFLVDATGEFYFLEMNTRLQVEHPVTEAVTGLDFVRAQIEIANGARLQDVLALMERPALEASGHAIEVRVYAENPDEGFLPSPGLITHLQAPSGPGVRDDSGAYAGWAVPTAYDPLVSKLIAWAPDRAGAIARMVRALDEYDVRGISTTIGFCRRLIASESFAAGDFDTNTVDRLLEQRSRAAAADEGDEESAVVAAALWAMRQAPLGRPVGRTSGAAAARPESLWGQRARMDGLR